MKKEKRDKIKAIVYELDRIDDLIQEVSTQVDLCWLNSKETLYLINTIWGKEATLDALNCRKEELERELDNLDNEPF